MANFNKVLLMGNLTRDPEVRYTPKGTAVANLGLAVNRSWTDESGQQKEEVLFVDVEVWGRQAENCGQYLSKGRPVFVEGRLRLDSWEDKESGQKRNKLKVVGERIQFLGAPRGGGPAEFSEQAPPAEDRPQRAAARGSKPAEPSREPGEPEPAPSEGEDNIPF